MALDVGHIVAFNRTMGMYVSGDKAWFASAEYAERIEAAGFGKIVQRSVPQVSPETELWEARRRADEAREALAHAEAVVAGAAAAAKRVKAGAS